MKVSLYSCLSHSALLILLFFVANETRELIINCCNEFIHLIASESNEVCNTQTKKTIAPEHVLLGKIFYSREAVYSLWGW